MRKLYARDERIIVTWKEMDISETGNIGTNGNTVRATLTSSGD